MEQFTIFLLGVSCASFTRYYIPRPHGTIRQLSIRVSCRVYTSFKIPGPMEQFAIFLLEVSFGVYTSYKIPEPHGTIRHISIRGFI